MYYYPLNLVFISVEFHVYVFMDFLWSSIDTKVKCVEIDLNSFHS